MEFAKYLEQKTVAIVGPAKGLVNQNLGKEIDSFDIVVRLNKALPIKGTKIKDIGTRTDILYNCLDGKTPNGGPIEPKVWSSCGVKWVCGAFPKNAPFLLRTRASTAEKVMEGIINLKWMSDETYKVVQKNIKGRPNTGLMAIVELLSFNIKELHIYGIDHFRTAYDVDYRKWGNNTKSIRKEFGGRNDRHRPDSQYKYFKKIYSEDKRISVQPYFEKILNDISYDNIFGE